MWKIDPFAANIENNNLNMTEKKYLIDLFNGIYVKSYFKLKVVRRIKSMYLVTREV
jgi:hypothetical protein